MTTKQASKPIKLTVPQRKFLESLKPDKFEFIEKRKQDMGMAVSHQDFRKRLTTVSSTYKRSELGTKWLSDNPAKV
jgi:hypothetical protein